MNHYIKALSAARDGGASQQDRIKDIEGRIAALGGDVPPPE